MMSFLGGSAFGKPANGTGFGSSGGMNANTTNMQQTQQPIPSLFGPLGQNQSQQAQQLPQQQQPSASMNMSTPFSSSTTSGNTLFGNKPAASPFGNATSTAPTATASNTGTSLFGGFGSGTNAGPQSGGTSGFGASSSGAGGTNLFGSATNTNMNQPGAGLFGQQNQQSKDLPSLFGQPQQQTQPTASLFGQSTPQAQPQSTGLFGNFGQSTAAPAGGLGLLGGSQAGNSLFPNAVTSTPGLFAGSNSPMKSQSHGDSAQAQFLNLVQRIEAIVQAWDPNSPNCRFQHFFYNLVDQSQIHLYGRPPNATNDALWQKALRENPDPTCYVPVLAVGFDDLQKRVDAQRALAAVHQEKLKELKTRIEALTSAHSSVNAPRLQRAVLIQVQLQQRLVQLVQHLHLLIPSIRSSSIRREEEALRSELERIDEEIRRPGGAGRLKGKLSELWAILGAIEAQKERGQKNNEGNIEWAVVDPEGMQQLIQILADQQNGIAHLIRIVKGHQRDLDIILGKPTQEREADAFSNPQASQVLLGASICKPI